MSFTQIKRRANGCSFLHVKKVNMGFDDDPVPTNGKLQNVTENRVKCLCLRNMEI